MLFEPSAFGIAFRSVHALKIVQIVLSSQNISPQSIFLFNPPILQRKRHAGPWKTAIYSPRVKITFCAWWKMRLCWSQNHPTVGGIQFQSLPHVRVPFLLRVAVILELPPPPRDSNFLLRFWSLSCSPPRRLELSPLGLSPGSSLLRLGSSLVQPPLFQTISSLRSCASSSLYYSIQRSVSCAEAT